MKRNLLLPSGISLAVLVLAVWILAPPSILEDDEVAVMNEVWHFLNADGWLDLRPALPVFVVDSTALESGRSSRPLGCFRPVQPQRWEVLQFRWRNLFSGRFPACPKGTESWQFVDGGLVDRIDKEGDFWTEFGRHVGRSYDFFRFSRVGFNRRRDHALVYLLRGCPLCGFGAYFSLVREGGDWRVQSTCLAWQS